MHNLRLTAAVAAMLFVLALTGCSVFNTGSGQSDTDSDSSVSNLEESLTADDVFTSEDYEVGYDDESDSASVTLTGDTAQSDSSSVSIDGSDITISSEGTYIITGTLTDGTLTIDAGDSDDVRLILSNASITSSGYAAIYCKNADNVYITLAQGSTNTLTSGGTFVQTDDSNVDGTVFAKTDLAINGSGSLEVTSECGHGIVCKDSLVITGGTIDISAASCGIQAKDSVAVSEASVNITSGKDGIHCENSDDAALGYVFSLPEPLR